MSRRYLFAVFLFAWLRWENLWSTIMQECELCAKKIFRQKRTRKCQRRLIGEGIPSVLFSLRELAAIKNHHTINIVLLYSVGFFIFAFFREGRQNELWLISHVVGIKLCRQSSGRNVTQKSIFPSASSSFKLEMKFESEKLQPKAELTITKRAKRGYF